MKVLMQLNKSAVFADKIFAVEPSEELLKEAVHWQIDAFEYDASSIDEALNMMNNMDSIIHVITENGNEGTIYNISDFTPYELEQAIMKWSEEPKIDEIQKLRKEPSKMQKKRMYTEYLMSGTGTLSKKTEQIKPDYYPGYKGSHDNIKHDK